ncbi:hypothetical protein COP2_041835 [Malus domestica]
MNWESFENLDEFDALRVINTIPSTKKKQNRPLAWPMASAGLWASGPVNWREAWALTYREIGLWEPLVVFWLKGLQEK